LITKEELVSYQPKPWNQPTWTIPQEIHPLKDSYINRDVLSTLASCLSNHYDSASVTQFTSRVSQNRLAALSSISSYQLAAAKSSGHQIVSHNAYLYT